mmetsp:Transcript_41480/g.81342  ORF Transcript_41480/g.81342 Transcript_41480/m.81342 type:complete len:707 (+) Transcript_41480:71-2191(+)
MLHIFLCLSSCLYGLGEQVTVTGKHGMVAATHFLATDVGAKVLESGGTAIDAAIAVQLALAVVEPQHVSLLGGGGMVYKLNNQPVHYVDFREEAPALYHPKTFCKNPDCLLNPSCDCSNGVWEDAERCTGGHAVGVPGVPALLEFLVTNNLTTKPLSDLAAPAASLADGFPMYDFLHQTILAYAPLLCKNRAAREQFLSEDCQSVKANVNDTFRQPGLARTLRERFDSHTSLRSFYTGSAAGYIRDTVKSAVNNVTGKYGLMSDSDLACYRAVRRLPVQFNYSAPDGSQYKVHGASNPLSGPQTLNLILKQLQRLQPMLEKHPEFSHGRFLDAQNSAFADRNRYMADPDFVPFPAELMSDEYADRRYSALFGGENASTGHALPTPISWGHVQSSGGTSHYGTSLKMDHGTSHMSIVDSMGNVVAMTTTVNSLMGSRVVVPELGVLLNDQLCDFDAVGIDPTTGYQTVNAPEGGKRERRTALPPDSASLGGKRPRSSMTPIIVEPLSLGGPVVAAFGAPGGTDIIGGVANVFRNLVLNGFKMDSLQAETDLPRIIGKNIAGTSGIIEWELYHDPTALGHLQRLGYNVSTTKTPRPYAVGETFSRVQSVVGDFRHTPWRYYGAADKTRFPECKAIGPCCNVSGATAPSNGYFEVNVVVMGLVLVFAAAVCCWRRRIRRDLGTYKQQLDDDGGDSMTEKDGLVVNEVGH